MQLLLKINANFSRFHCNKICPRIYWNELPNKNFPSTRDIAVILLLRQFFIITAWPHCISGQVLSRHSIVSSSRTVRLLSPWGGRWIGHWRTTWSTVCSSAPHSQAAEETMPHLYKQGQKRPTRVRRRLSRIQTVLGRAIPRGWVTVSGIKVRSLVGLSSHSAFYWWFAQCAARMLFLSDKLMSCCAASTKRCLDLRRRAFALDGQVNAEWSRCPGYMARHAKTVWLQCVEAQHVGCLWEWEGCPLV